MWKQLLVHAFNPILIGFILLSREKQHAERATSQPSAARQTGTETSQEPALELALKDAPGIYLGGLIFYSLIWFLPHYLLASADFDSGAFFGAGEPIIYTFPYAFGFYFLLNITAIRPVLVRRASSLLGVNTALNTALFLASAYCLLVFYLKWH